MGRDAHVGKDPENKKGKSESTPEPSSLLRESEGIPGLDMDPGLQVLSPIEENSRKSSQKNPPGHVELQETGVLKREGQLLREKHSGEWVDKHHFPSETVSKLTKAEQHFVDGGKKVTQELLTNGAGLYEVGKEIGGTGSTVTAIEISEVTSNTLYVPLDGTGTNKRVYVHLGAFARLTFEKDHLVQVDSGPRFLVDGNARHYGSQFQYDDKGMLVAVTVEPKLSEHTFDAERFLRVGPNKWHHQVGSCEINSMRGMAFKDHPNKIWNGSFELEPNCSGLRLSELGTAIIGLFRFKLD